MDELVIYGSSRLGSYNGKTDQGKRTLGNKKYELSNHLGNVLSVISDNKIGIGTNGVADYYEPLVISESDYYPFGMAMKERSFSNEEYRFGFNTQEKSTELGEDTYTAEFWQYDSKIAKRLNTDPVIACWESSYAVNRDNPISLKDPKGDCPEGVDCSDPLENMQIRRNRASNLGPGNVRNGGNRPHSGHDLFAPVGTNVRSVMSGTVIAVGVSTSYGNYVTIRHTFDRTQTRTELDPFTGEARIITEVVTETYYSFYAHLSNTNVNVNQRVGIGTDIGETGTTGNASSGADNGDEHLHFEFGTTLRAGGTMLASTGLLNPNEAYKNVSFHSADPDANQSNTNVVKVNYDNDRNKILISLQFLYGVDGDNSERVLYYKDSEGEDHFLINRIGANGQENP